MHRLLQKTSIALGRVALFASIVMVLTVDSRAADLTVIVNPSIEATEISTNDLRSVFLGTKTALNAMSIKPVLAKSGAVHEAFLKEYLGKTDSALQTYYRSLVFTGKSSMPVAFDSDEEVIAYVGRTRGAIGYIKSGMAVTGVKTLKIK
jgi:hypothetical protein